MIASPIRSGYSIEGPVGAIRVFIKIGDGPFFLDPVGHGDHRDRVLHPPRSPSSELA